MVDQKELKQRIASLQASIRQNNWSGVMIFDYINIYYYCGTAQKGLLLVGSSDEPILLIKKSVSRAKEETPWTVTDWPGMRGLPAALKRAGLQEGTVGMELDILPVNEYLRYKEVLKQEPVDASPVLKVLRMVKSESELELIKNAAAKHDQVFYAAQNLIIPGKSEIEIAAEVEAFSRRQGHQGFVPFHGFNEAMFFGHLMAGKQAAMPSCCDSPTGGRGITPIFPQGASLEPIQVNTPVLIDYVGRYGSYMVDQSRVYCSGKLPENLDRAHRLALEIQQTVAAAAIPGASSGELYQLAVEMAAKGGFGDHFMGFSQPVSFIGHGIGLELNELPIIAKGTNTKLVEGMVFALEPKFTFPGQGVVGTENTFIVTSGGAIQLGKHPDTITYLS